MAASAASEGAASVIRPLRIKMQRKIQHHKQGKHQKRVCAACSGKAQAVGRAACLAVGKIAHPSGQRAAHHDVIANQRPRQHRHQHAGQAARQHQHSEHQKAHKEFTRQHTVPFSGEQQRQHHACRRVKHLGRGKKAYVTARIKAGPHGDAQHIGHYKGRQHKYQKLAFFQCVPFDI